MVLSGFFGSGSINEDDFSVMGCANRAVGARIRKTTKKVRGNFRGNPGFSNVTSFAGTGGYERFAVPPLATN
jgi:hypothetical protein